MKWYLILILVIVFSLLIFGCAYSISTIKPNRMDFDECDNKYEEGNCSLYQCKMNYSLTSSISNTMYTLYHICIMNDKNCVEKEQ